MIRNRLMYFCAVLVCAVFICINDNASTYAVLYIVLAFPVISWVFSAISLKSFSVREELSSSTATKGAEVEYVFIAENSGFIAYSRVKAVFKSDSEALKSNIETQVFSVEGHERKEIVFNVACGMRGEFTLGVTGVVLYDLLGLYRFKIRTKNTLTLTVLPRILELAHFPLESYESESLFVKNALTTEDFAVVSDLRQYRPMDSLKRIHWKATARKNELIVKKFQAVSKNVTLLCVDNCRIVVQNGVSALVLEDLVIEAVVSVANFCQKKQFPVKLLNREKNCENGNFGEKMGFFDEIYHETAHMNFKENSLDNFGKCISNACDVLGGSLNIVVFAQNLSQELCKTLRELKLLGNNVIVLEFDYLSELQKKRTTNLEGCGIVYAKIDENTIISDVFGDF